MSVPHSLEAERAVLGRIMSVGPKVAGQVVGSLLEPEHFYAPAHRALYTAILDAYYADEPVEPLTIGEVCSKQLSKVWKCDENDAIVRVRNMAVNQTFTGNVIDHAKVVKRHADLRRLLDLSQTIRSEVADEVRGPEEIAGLASQEAMRIATNTLLTHEIVPFGELGRRYVRAQQRSIEAKKKGIELGAKFGLPFIDAFLHGLQPSELWILGGEPGSGKSATGWKAAINFAQRQMVKPQDQRIGTFVLSLEMSEPPSSIRIAQTLAGIDSGKLREGDVSENEMRAIIYEWGRRKDIPLYFNFTSQLRAAQLRALVVEAIRRHNVGLVVIDHFRYFDMDYRYQNKNDEDEDKARFLKESVAKDLDTAVICIAHTTKGIENQPDRRPTLSHLRGSGQVAAHADFVSFVYRPYAYASDEAKADGSVKETDAEMIWRKARFAGDSIAPYYFEPSKMLIR